MKDFNLRELKAFNELLNPSFARQGGYSFDGRKNAPVVTASSRSVADSIVNMLCARAELMTALKNVPSYTAQWSDEDYVRDEQAAYDEACNHLLETLKSALLTE